MRLIVASDESSVVAIDDLRPYIEHGSLSVRLDATATVMAAIREAVTALAPADSSLREMDPVRQEEVAQIILGVASAAGRLADNAAADDPDAMQVKVALQMLHLA